MAPSGSTTSPLEDNTSMDASFATHLTYRAKAADMSAENFGSLQTLEGSFSAVSTPIFATKYSFCKIFQDLQNELAEFF